MDMDMVDMDMVDIDIENMDMVDIPISHIQVGTFLVQFGLVYCNVIIMPITITKAVIMVIEI